MLCSVIMFLLVFVDPDLVSADHSTLCIVSSNSLPQSSLTSSRITSLNCSVKDGKLASRILWKRRNQVLKQAVGPIKWLDLSLTAVNRTGHLRCEVMVTKQNHSCRLSHEVHPRITSLKRMYEVFVGTSVVIPCRATGSPEPRFTWIKRARTFATQDMPQSVKQVRSHESLDLVIKKVSMRHSGIYTCHVVNRLGQDVRVVFVIPQYYTISRPPRVVSLKQFVTVHKGSTAVLACSVKNTPRRYTAVFWDHYGTKVKNTARHHMRSRYSIKIVKKKYKDERVDMSLAISQVTIMDIGLYTCGVVTNVGRDEDHVHLRIKTD